MFLILFDVDGTLVDSQQTILHGLQVAYEAVSLPMPDRSTALSIVGLSLERAFSELLEPHQQHLVDEMAQAYRVSKVARREQGLDFDPLYPGAREAIERLNRRPDVLLGLATGKARRGVDHMLEVHDLAGRFVTIQTADTSPSKPHPDMILRALAETGADKAAAIMIGDTGFDMAMARSAGVAALGVSWGYHDRHNLMQNGAQAVLETFEDLDPALAKLLDIDKEPA